MTFILKIIEIDLALLEIYTVTADIGLDTCLIKI